MAPPQAVANALPLYLRVADRQGRTSGTCEAGTARVVPSYLLPEWSFAVRARAS